MQHNGRMMWMWFHTDINDTLFFKDWWIRDVTIGEIMSNRKKTERIDFSDGSVGFLDFIAPMKKNGSVGFLDFIAPMKKKNLNGIIVSHLVILL
ncbi:hypothetical protein DICVIV_08897 [Dictyocaulus viviparus]|uniref:Uncharacterized protein n=1 Tax=Dictyocaulus viviparus TaxID=29172 RepID=A0A0D8XKK0_DICVI|nr:hypothetical protein DICVIV_08897 [Dictyocaulus viviparus]